MSNFSSNSSTSSNDINNYDNGLKSLDNNKNNRKSENKNVKRKVSNTNPEENTKNSSISNRIGYLNMTKAKNESCKCDIDLENIECFLESDDLWKKFHDLGTEMIITKSGRRMFPSIRVSFNGVKSSEKYLIAMDIVPTDNKRYRYAYHRSSWLVAGKADPPVQSRIFLHPDGPFTGDSLQKQIISFEKLKLTNNESDKFGHVRY